MKLLSIYKILKEFTKKLLDLIIVWQDHSTQEKVAIIEDRQRQAIIGIRKAPRGTKTTTNQPKAKAKNKY